MRLVLHRRTNPRMKARLKNRVRIRRKLSGDVERPRLCVYRSLKHFYAQVIDDTKGVTIVSVSTKADLAEKTTVNVASVKQLGIALAKKALEKNVKNVVFDRSGYIYHGRIKSFADGAREGGLNF